MTTVPSTRTAATGAEAPPAGSAMIGAAVRRVYFVRGVFAIAWAAGFATVADSLTTASRTLLVIYPVIDVVATLVDSRGPHSTPDHKVLWFDAATSAAAAVALAIADAHGIAATLHVFGVWATVSGLAQIVVALRRRGPQGGGQWPMFIAGGLSVLVGAFYNIEAAGDDPKLTDLIAYAAAGGLFFVVQAAILARRSRRAAALGSTH